MKGWHDLRVQVVCVDSGATLHGKTHSNYQTKKGTWEKSFTVKKGETAPHEYSMHKELK